VRRARTLLARADLALALRSIDSEPYRMDGEVPVLRLATKSDLDGRSMPGELPISVKTGAGIPELLARIVERLQGLDRVEPALLTRERHRIAVADAIAALERALAARHGQSELLAEELRIAVLALERLVGRIDVEDVLDRLFSGFCIGK
jgi:tRNA modification GTPase